MRIRKARWEDLDYIIKSIHNICIYENNINSKINTKQPLKNYYKWIIAKEIVDNDYLILIAEEKWEKVWILTWEISGKNSFWNYKKFSDLNFLYVEEEHRKKWYAKKLCNRFFEWAKKKWSDRVLLNALGDNFRAIEFYEKLWFSTHTVNLWKNL
jgi:GNAT superfamily N-acetyltransferase